MKILKGAPLRGRPWPRIHSRLVDGGLSSAWTRDDIARDHTAGLPSLDLYETIPPALKRLGVCRDGRLELLPDPV